MTAPSALTSYPPQVQSTDFGVDLLFWWLVAVVLLTLAAFAVELRKNNPKAIFHLRMVGNLIIAYVVVCGPVAYTSYQAYVHGMGFHSIYLALLPIFYTGLSLDKNMGRVVRQTHQD